MAGKCCVKGCNNRVGEGGFVGPVCVPCYNLLATGKITSPGTTFIHELVHMSVRILDAALRYASEIEAVADNETLRDSALDHLRGRSKPPTKGWHVMSQANLGPGFTPENPPLPQTTSPVPHRKAKRSAARKTARKASARKAVPARAKQTRRGPAALTMDASVAFAIAGKCKKKELVSVQQVAELLNPHNRKARARIMEDTGNTEAARSSKVSGVSGWKFAGLRSRSVS